MLNEKFLISLVIFYRSLTDKTYKGTNEEFSLALRDIFNLDEDFGNKGMVYATKNYSLNEREHIFYEFSKYASLIYFGDEEIINKEILKYLMRG